MLQMLCRIVAAIAFLLQPLPLSPSVMPVVVCDAPIVGIDVAVVIVLDRDGWYRCLCVTVVPIGVERCGTVHRVENAATAFASEYCERILRMLNRKSVLLKILNETDRFIECLP